MKITLAFFCFIFCFNASAQDNLSALIPYPNNVIQKDSRADFEITPSTYVYYSDSALSFAANELKNIISGLTGISVNATRKPEKILPPVGLFIDTSIKGDESYVLDINSHHISIKACNAKGIYYGVMTLHQIMLGDVASTNINQIKPLRIEDSPILPYRALMLDPARHFLPVAAVKKYIRQMAAFKFNTLQLHLSDDQGWRIEIKSHPRLTEIGAFRRKDGSNQGPYNGFYTQQEIRDLVEYAAQYHIQIVPEIDVPGHTVSMLIAYPDLRVEAYKDSTFDMNKTVNMMLSAANEEVYKVLDDVLHEIAGLFPSRKIHLGGDESVIEANWGKSPENIALMKKMGYDKPEQLMNYFFGKVLQSAERYDLDAILWCELDNIYPPATAYLFNYPDDVTLVSWRNGLTPTAIDITRENNNALILAPGEHAYLDYPQYQNDFPEHNNWGMPLTTLEKSYQFDPMYGLPADKTQHIIGIMGTLWGEAIMDINRANYMTWPRGFALAEAGWSSMQNREWESFKKRIVPNITQLMKNGTAVRVPFELWEKE